MENQIAPIIFLVVVTILCTLTTIRLIIYIKEKWFQKPKPRYEALDKILGKQIEFKDKNLGTQQGIIHAIEKVKGKAKDGGGNYDLIISVGHQKLRHNIYAQWRYK